MKKILILGPGCARCNKLYETAMEAASQLELESDIRKVTDIQEMTKYGIAMTPALVVDGVVKVSGRIPDVDEVKKLLS